MKALALAVVLALAGPIAAAQQPFQPAVIVNDQVVTWYDLDQRMRLLVFNGAPRSPELQSIALDQLIDDRLKRGAARAAGVTAGPQDIENALSDYRAQRNLSEAQLAQGLAQAGADRRALEEALAADVEWRTVVRRRFGPRAEPGEADIDQELALGAGQRGEVRIAEIVIPTGARGEAETRRLAETIVRDLSGGADFTAAARRHSASPTAAAGGEVGWLPIASLPPVAAEAVARAPAGGVTEPFAVPGGVAILKVLDRRDGAAAADREAVRAQIRSQRLARFAATWLQDLRADAVIERR